MFGCHNSGTGGDTACVPWVETRDTAKDPTIPPQPPQQRIIWLEMLRTLSYTFRTKVRTAKAMVFPVLMYKCESWTITKTECWRTDAFELWFCRRLLRVPWRARRSNQSILGNQPTRWKGWCWSSNTMASWFKELTHSKRPWYWERLKAGREGDDRGWDGQIASLTQWTWVWASSGTW